jgi:hypothetical protein
MTDDAFARYVIENWIKGVILILLLFLVWQYSVLHRNFGGIKSQLDAITVGMEREGLGE